MSLRLVIIPRWGGGPSSDWYPWLAAESQAARPRLFGSVEVAAMPDPDRPTVPAWVQRVREALGDDRQELGRTVIAGHSVGCQAVLRALALYPADVRVAGVLFVAGWFWVDAPWESLVPWIESPTDLARSRTVAGERIMAILSDDDPFTSDWRANGAAWQERLGASVSMVSGAQHFNGARYPIILQTLLDHFAPRGDSSCQT